MPSSVSARVTRFSVFPGELPCSLHPGLCSLCSEDFFLECELWLCVSDVEIVRGLGLGELETEPVRVL